MKTSHRASRPDSLKAHKTPLASAVTLALLGAAGSAWSQAAPPAASPSPASPGSAAVQTVVITVTAQGRRENILKIPYNISAVSGEEIERKLITEQAELLRNVAGASVVDRGSRNSGVISGITLRGLNVNGSALGDYQTSAVPTVSTYVNGTPIYANFLIKDIERVEVLRGPQGTLYGSGSLGGTVRYITRQPDARGFEGHVEASLSKTDGSGGINKTADAMVNVPLGKEWALRAVAGRVDNAGVIDYKNVYVLDGNGVPVAPSGVTSTAASYRTVKDADTEKINYGRFSLLYKPDAGTSALLTFASQSDDIGGRRQPTEGNNGAGVPYGKYENGSVQLEPSSRKVNLGALELSFDLGFATLTSGTSHYDQHGQSLSENTGFYAKNLWLATYYLNYPRPMATADRSYGDKAWVEEVRLASKKGETFDYVVGAYIQDQKLKATQMSYLRGLKAYAEAIGQNWVETDNDFVFIRNQTFKEKALFGELTWKFTPDFRATLGARNFHTDFDNNSILGSGVFFPNDVPIQTVFAQKDKGTLYKGNLAYDLAPDQLLYATVSQGYRRGGANAVPLTGNFAEPAAFQYFKPDTNTNYEVGFKGGSSTLRYSAALFRIDWKDIQLDTATPVWGFFAAQNGGKASSKGLELELSGKLAEAWRYGLGYSLVNAQLDDDVGRADDPSIIIAKSGTRLPGTAKNTVSASLDHTLVLENGLSWVNRIGGYYQGPTENAISESARFKKTWPGFSLWNFSSSLQSEKWTATAFVKNITNERGVTGGFLEAYMGTSPSQNYEGNGSKVFISRPRTIGLALSYDL
jgi:outer membrane receptor protein involved in Fe transport